MKKILWSCDKSSGNDAFIVRAELCGLHIEKLVSKRVLLDMPQAIFGAMAREIISSSKRADPVEVLRQAIESNKRYVAQTGRASEAVVLHPDHAAALLELLK